MKTWNWDSAPVEPWEIEAHLDGFSDKRVAAFLRQNPAAAVLREQSADESFLSETLYRSDCPDSFDVLNYQWGLLEGDEAVVIAAHLSICPHCAVEAQELAQPLLKENSQPTRASIWSRLSGSIEKLRHIVARPLSQGEMALAAVRSDSAEQDHTQIYRVDQLGWDIILEHEPSPYYETVHLHGYLLLDQLPEGHSLQISLLDGNTIVATAEIDSLGSFDFPAIASQAYTLCIHDGDMEVCLPHIVFN